MEILTNRSDKMLIWITIISIGGFVGFATFTSSLAKLIPFIGFIPLTTTIIKIIQDHSKNKRIQEKILEYIVNPTISPLVGLLQNNYKISSEDINEFKKEAIHGIKTNSDITPTVVWMSYKFAKLIKVDETFLKSYSLAIAHALSLMMDVKEGSASREINSSVTKRKKILAGNEMWTIKNEDIDWYKRFSFSDALLHTTFESVYGEVKNFGISKVEKSIQDLEIQVETLTASLKDNDVKLNRILRLILQTMPKVDFFKILASLRTEIVIISKEGFGDEYDKADSSHTSGSKYLKQALEELKINFGRLNYSVVFAFLSDIMKNVDPHSFNLNNWGKQIENRAIELRKLDEREERKFDFAILKSSLHDFQFFGDKIGEKTRIQIPPELLNGLKSNDASLSTLVLISKALQQEEISLHDFIDRNLEYLDGITDSTIAKKLSESLCKKFGNDIWKISDFANCKIIDLEEIGLTKSHSQFILDEAKTISELLLKYKLHSN